MKNLHFEFKYFILDKNVRYLIIFIFSHPKKLVIDMDFE